MRTRIFACFAGIVLGVGGVAACGEDDAPPTAAGVGPAAERNTDREANNRRVLEIPEARYPTVQVRRGERAELHATPGGRVVATVGDETEWGSPTVFAVHRKRGAWAGVPNPYLENGRLGWIRLDPARLRAGSVYVAIDVDLSEFEARLIVAGEVKRRFAVSIGSPEAPTPTGRFAVTDTFRGGLNPAYGCCAVATTARQTRLPSGWLGGDRIAIHGTSGPLGAAISHGCVRAADPDVNSLIEWVPPGAPVTIRQ